MKSASIRTIDIVSRGKHLGVDDRQDPVVDIVVVDFPGDAFLDDFVARGGDVFVDDDCEVGRLD